MNEAFVKEFFPMGSPVGRRIKPGTADAKDPWLTIVGVVGNVSRPTLFMRYSQGSAIYRPLRQEPSNLGLPFLFVPPATFGPMHPASCARLQTSIAIFLCPPSRRSMSHFPRFWLSLNSARSYSASSPGWLCYWQRSESTECSRSSLFNVLTKSGYVSLSARAIEMFCGWFSVRDSNSSLPGSSSESLALSFLHAFCQACFMAWEHLTRSRL